MSVAPNSGLAVRVLDANGSTVGLGVLVSPREILTCAHVVNAALSRDRRAQDRPVGEITVEPAGGDGPPMRARVQRWLPPPRTGHTGWVRGVAFSPDGTLLATTSTDGTARLWDPATGALRATLLALDKGGYAVFRPDGSYKPGGRPGPGTLVGHQAMSLRTR